jgi:hypothetical protein
MLNIIIPSTFRTLTTKNNFSLFTIYLKAMSSVHRTVSSEKINELLMIWKKVFIVQFQYVQIFAWRDWALSCNFQSGELFSWPRFEIGIFRKLRNAAYSTLKLGNLFLVETFAVCYWEEEHE